MDTRASRGFVTPSSRSAVDTLLMEGIRSTVETDGNVLSHVRMMRDALTEAVRRAVHALPVSRRELARRAGLAHTTLNRIANDQQRATPEVAQALAHVLKGLAGEVGRARNRILAVLNDAREET